MENPRKKTNGDRLKNPERKHGAEAIYDGRQSPNQAYALLEAVTQGTDVIIAAQDLEFRYIFFNKAYQAEIRRLTGKDLRIGMNMMDLFEGMPEQREVATREWRRALNGENVRLSIEFGDPARRRRVYNSLKSPLRNSDGRIWGAGEVAWDITALAESEEALRESEWRFRSVLENSPDAVYRFNLQKGRFDYLSPAVESITGVSGEDIGHPDFSGDRNRIHPDDWLRVREDIGRALSQCRESGKGTGTIDFRFRREDGRWIWLADHFSFIADPLSGQPLYRLGNIRDITRNKEMENELRMSRDALDRRVAERTRELALSLDRIKQDEELLRTVLEILPVGVWILDKTGTIRLANETARTIWGGVKYVGLEQLGEYKGWRVGTGKKVEAEDWAGARAVLKGETSLHEEIEIETFDGGRKIIMDSAVPLWNEAREITGAVTVNQDITARRKGETSRREQTAALDLAHDAIFDCALDGRILSWNRGAELLYGWTKEEALGQISHLFLHSEFPEPIERITEKIIQNGRWEGEFYQIDRRGVRITTSGRWVLKVDGLGRPTGILKINIDITENKKAEEALKSSWLYTRSLIEASLDALVTISADGKITDVNMATELMTEVPRQKLIGSDFSEYFTQPDKAREGYRLVFSEGAVRNYPLTMRKAGGGFTDVLYNATVYRNEKGEVQGAIAAARDITERKKAEEERLRLVKALEQTAEGVVIMDTDLEILFVNSAFEQISGLRSQDILRSSYEDVLRMTGEIDGSERRFEAALSQGRRWSGHMIRKRKDGSEYELDTIISPVLDEGGNLRNFVAVERDVTEEVRFQENLRQGQKMEALGTLAGGIAHDFNNILMPILINTETALMDAVEGSVVSKQLKVVLEAANRGKALVKQITTFSRRKEPEKNIVKINPIFKEGLKFLRSSIPKNIEIIDRIKAASATVLGDATQIHQILMNLCSNAAYALREKGGVLEVGLSEIEADSPDHARRPELKPGPYLRLWVRDTGHGMTPEIKNKIFDPFFTTKAPGEGAGMGLPVVHGIVKAMGGAIRVDSEVGKGSAFEIFFPRIRSRPLSRPVFRRAPVSGQEKILFIDDEDIQVRSVPPALERLGYRVVGRIDARKALRSFRERPQEFDLVITDQMMPFLTGDRLSAQLLEIRPDLPIILCTGFSEAIDEDKAKAMGIAALLMKPFSVRELAATIRRVLKAKA